MKGKHAPLASNRQNQLANANAWLGDCYHQRSSRESNGDAQASNLLRITTPKFRLSFGTIRSLRQYTLCNVNIPFPFPSIILTKNDNDVQTY